VTNPVISHLAGRAVLLCRRAAPRQSERRVAAPQFRAASERSRLSLPCRCCSQIAVDVIGVGAFFGSIISRFNSNQKDPGII
jgi:hypothetical protein